MLRKIWSKFWGLVGELNRRRRNLFRRLARAPLDYIFVEFYGRIPQLPQVTPWWRRLLPRIREPKQGMSLAEFREIAEYIANDPRLSGVVIRLNSPDADWATMDGLRDAIQRLQAAGKRAVVWTDDLSAITWYAALAADHLALAPAGHWNVTGFRAGGFFLADALARIGVQSEVLQVSPYKSAGDTFSRNNMSDEQRQMLEWIIDGILDRLAAAATGRNLDRQALLDLIDRAPLTADQALDAGIVDSVGYLDELATRLSDTEQPIAIHTANEAGHRIYEYRRRPSGKFVGVVPVEGMIVPGRSVSSPLMPGDGQKQAGADTVSKAIRIAEEQAEIAAVVLYVNSRGGSALASDQIWREVERLKSKKPVVAWFGDTAASGGYYVAAGANRIIAQPLTVTGSIGVMMLRPNVQGLLQRASIQTDFVTVGRHAGIFGGDRPLTDDEREVLTRSMMHSYDQFLDRVVTGRGMGREQLEAVAGGRVWLGHQALAHGLVDELGDLRTALHSAAELAGLPVDRWTPGIEVLPRGQVGFPQLASDTADAFAGLTSIATSGQSLYLMPWRVTS